MDRVERLHIKESAVVECSGPTLETVGADSPTGRAAENLARVREPLQLSVRIGDSSSRGRHDVFF